MSLEVSALENELKDIYKQMRDAAADSPKSDDWLAAKLAKAITDHILTAEVNAGIAVSGGTQTGGALTGAQTSAKGSLS